MMVNIFLSLIEQDKTLLNPKQHINLPLQTITMSFIFRNGSKGSQVKPDRTDAENIRPMKDAAM